MPTGEDHPDGPAPRNAPPTARPIRRGTVTRRAALALGGVAVVGVGAACLGPYSSGSDDMPRTRRVAVDRPTGEPLLRGPVVDVRSVGAVGDGRTDDGPAIRRGLQQAADRQGTLFFPAGEYGYRIGEVLAPLVGVTVSGEPGRSVIRLLAPTTDDHGTFCRPAGSGVTVEGLVIERVEDFDCVLVALPDVTDTTISRTTFVGNVDRYPSTYCHGVQLGVVDGATTRGVRWTDSVITTMSYGLLQTNASTGTTQDIQVTRCRFVANASTDLEFNSPRGSTRAIRVVDCEFRDHGTTGFAVGLATCSDATLSGNTMRGYPQEAIHVEDYSRDVRITGNTVSSAGLERFSHVQLIGGANDVTITGNTFDATMNRNEISVVWALAGGTSPTPGGRPVAPPSRVEVRDNTFAVAEGVRAVSFEGVTGGRVSGNRLTGPGVPPDDPGAAIVVRGGTGITVEANR